MATPHPAAPSAASHRHHPRVRLLGETLTVTAVAVWVTGLFVSGALVAPVVFGSLADPAEAGRIMQPIFRRLDFVYLLAALALGVGESVSAWGAASLPWPRLTRLVVAGGMVFSAGWTALVVHPEMAALRLAGFTRGEGPHWARFDALHHLSEAVAFAQLAGGLLLAMLVFACAWRRAR